LKVCCAEWIADAAAEGVGEDGQVIGIHRAVEVDVAVDLRGPRGAAEVFGEGGKILSGYLASPLTPTHACAAV
jgi:hypothetical protein